MENIEKILGLVEEAVSPFHTAEAVRKMLTGNGFEELVLGEDWKLEPGKAYSMTHHGSSIFAFTVGEKFQKGDGFRIAASHGDFPGFRVKPNPEMTTDGYERLNIESYGGVNIMSWLDRPLSIAGRVALRSKDPFHPEMRLVDVKRPMMTIPNLAMHLNREMNKGVELNKQTEILPITGMIENELNKDGRFMEFLSSELKVKKEEILEYELNVYHAAKGQLIGINEDMLLAPRLDNLTSVLAVTEGIMESRREKGINVAVVFDHEEIGSRTKQGAGSTLLLFLLRKIYASLGYTEIDFMNDIMDSFLMSVDVSHALHPGFVQKYDPTNQNILNHGFAVKQASSQSYATDCQGIAVVLQICEKNQIPYQKFVNRSDVTGGGTLGSIASAMLPVQTVDIGVPLLAMHSSCETMGVKDQESLTEYLKAFFAL